MNFDDALNQASPPDRPPQEHTAPKGWEPGIRWSNETNEGEITTPPLESEPDAKLWERIIEDFGLSPDELEIIDGSLSLIGWKSPVKGASPDDPPEKQTVNLTRYKVRLRRRVRSDAELDRIDVDELCRLALERTDPVPVLPHASELGGAMRAMVVACSDWQIGKGEGDGSRGTFDRITESIAKVRHRINELAAINRGPHVVYLVGLGDLIEQCANHYPGQTFQVDLNRRDQMRVVRRLLLSFVDALVEDGLSVVLSAVPGNHGENRNNGKAYTDVTDNDDLAVVEQVAEVMSANPERYANVSTMIAKDYAVTLDVAGIPVGFFHGHVTKGGSHPQKKIEDWWTGQVMGGQDTVRDAKILVTAHYHHWCSSESSGRTWFQCPAMDPGSHWWTSITGQHSQSGMLTFMVGKMYGKRGWGDLMIC